MGTFSGAITGRGSVSTLGRPTAGDSGYNLAGRGSPNAPVAVPVIPFDPYVTPIAEPDGISAADFTRSITSPGASGGASGGGLLQAALQQALQAQFMRSGRAMGARNDSALFGATGISRIAAGLRKGRGLSAFGSSSGNGTGGGTGESVF